MFDISADTYPENCVHTINVIKKDNKLVLWVNMHDIKDKLGVKNMFDLTINAIKSIYDTENPTKNKLKKKKRYGKEFIENLTLICIREDIALSIKINRRIPMAIEFRTKLGFNQHDLIMAKQQ